MQASNHVPPLAEYVDLRTLSEIPQVKICFPSLKSARWFIDHNRKRLIDSASVIKVAGRLMIHPDSFQKAVVEVGREVAITTMLDGEQ